MSFTASRNSSLGNRAYPQSIAEDTCVSDSLDRANFSQYIPKSQYSEHTSRSFYASNNSAHWKNFRDSSESAGIGDMSINDRSRKESALASDSAYEKYGFARHEDTEALEERRNESMHTSLQNEGDVFVNLIPSINMMQSSGSERSYGMMAQSSSRNESSTVSFQDAQTFLKKQEEAEDSFLADLPPPSDTKHYREQKEYSRAESVEYRSNTTQSSSNSMPQAPIRPENKEEREHNAEYTKIDSRSLSGVQLRSDRDEYPQNGFEPKRSRSIVYTNRMNEMAQDAVSSNDNDSVIETMKRGPLGIQDALGELNTLMESSSLRRNRKTRIGKSSMMAEDEKLIPTKQEEGHANSEKAITRPIVKDATSCETNSKAIAQSVTKESTNSARPMNPGSINAMNIQDETKGWYRSGHVKSRNGQEQEKNELSSCSNWTEKFFGLSFSSVQSEQSDIFERYNPNSHSTTEGTHKKNAYCGARESTKQIRLQQSVHSIKESPLRIMTKDLKTRKDRMSTAELQKTLERKDAYKDPIDDTTSVHRIQRDTQVCTEEGRACVDKESDSNGLVEMKLPRYENIRLANYMPRQNSRYSRRFLCTVGDVIKEKITFHNSSNSTARICFTLLPLSMGCDQYTISPAVLELSATASNAFVITFMATRPGVSAGILQFRGVDSNFVFAPYEVLIESCVKELSALPNKEKPRAKHTQIAQEMFEKSDEFEKIEEVDENEKSSEKIEIRPTFVRFSADPVNGIDNGTIQIINRHVSPFAFKAQCAHENIQLSPMEGTVNARSTFKLQISLLSQPHVRASEKRDLEHSQTDSRKSMTAESDVWYGSFSLMIGASFSREVSVVLDKSVYKTLPTFEEYARRRHGLRHQTDSFYYTKKLNRHGLYFHARAVECGNCPVGESHKVPVYICNGSNVPMTVFLQELNAPFSCKYVTTTIQPRKFIEVLVSFTPKVRGKVSTSLFAYSLSEKASVTLIARGV